MNDKNTFYKCDTTARIRTLISSFGDYCATIAQQPQTYAVYFQVVPNRLEIAQHMKRICVASLFYVKATFDCALVRGEFTRAKVPRWICTTDRCFADSWLY